MIVAGSASPLLLSSAGGGYNLTNSLRFRRSASASLYRTPSSGSTKQKATFSFWVKRGVLGYTYSNLFSTYTALAGGGDAILFESDKLRLWLAGGTGASVITTQVFRDPSAWYHVIVAIDTTQATASDRVKMYVNGSQITSFTTASYPTQNYTFTEFFDSTAQQYIARGYGDYFDGYFAETNVIDGQQLPPSSFGQTNTKTGVWQPIKYTGTYGTNGYYLPFTDNSALTTSSNVGLGKDFSGNGNYWTTSNISITAGSTYDSMTDVPTLTSTTAANYCVLNPLNSPAVTLSNANLTVLTNTSGTNYSFATMAMPTSGKWYWEYVGTSNGSECYCGISNESRSKSVIYYAGTGLKYVDNVGSSYGATYGNNDVIGVAVDIGANTVTFYKNNTSQGAISYTFGSEIFFPYFADGSSSVGVFINANFGQQPFAYTPPTGFVALNTFNLPTPTIGETASTQAGDYFNPVLYTGNGSTQSITGVGFKPDFVWIKKRSSLANHALFDSVRGTTKVLRSDTTEAEFTASGVTSFDSDGFSLGSVSDMNQSTSTFVAWNWRASNATAVTNTAGSITSTVSANTSAGFSVVTYTGNGSAATVGHGLGVAPSMIIVKCRQQDSDWPVYHVSQAATKFANLNATSAFSSNSAPWNNTSPTSSVFTVGTSYGTNWPSNNMVAYCFSEVAGYSKFGSYIGNGNTSGDGPFVNLGFKPAFFMCKASNSTNSWEMLDNKRLTYNGSGSGLYLNANEAVAENAYGTASSGTEADFLSNGIKIKGGTAINANGITYIYMAFAENPFKYSLAR